MFNYMTLLKLMFYLLLIYVAWLIIKRAMWTFSILAIGIYLGFQLSYELDKIKKTIYGSEKPA